MTQSIRAGVADGVVTMRKKLCVAALVFIGLVGLLAVFAHVERNRVQAEAEVLLRSTVHAVRDDAHGPDMAIRVDPGVDGSDLVTPYTVTWRDYTFGAHEFSVRFPNGSEYWFDLEMVDGRATGSVKPVRPRMEVKAPTGTGSGNDERE